MQQNMSRDNVCNSTVGYLVHDLNDAAVARRSELLAQGGLNVRIGGFRRRAMPEKFAGAVQIIDMGVTKDMRLIQRVWAVIWNLVRTAKARSVVAGVDVIVARNLEMLMIAAWTRTRNQRLIYECLDIHNLLLSNRKIGQILRALERQLLTKISMIIISSPAYADHYFRERQGFEGPILLIENKVPFDSPSALVQADPRAGAYNNRPWRIGWFGIIRCRKSLLMLATMCAASAGKIEVLIAGRVNFTAIPDFDSVIASSPGLTFVGSYRLDQLTTLYCTVDFAWAVDFYEEGLNSSWLLPNRLYESLSAGVPPLALADVEAGRWLDREKVGRTFRTLDTEVLAFLLALDSSTYSDMRNSVAALPMDKTRFVADEAEQIVANILVGASKENV